MAINPACNALTDVARMRAAGFGGSAKDDALQAVINALSAMLERECDRVFRRIKYGEGGDKPAQLVQGSGRKLLLLHTYPVLSVERVVIDGSEVTDWKLIEELAEWGALYRRSGWPRREGSWGDLVADPDGQPDYNIEVSYTGGFCETPADLEWAIWQESDLVAAGTGAKASRRIKSEKTAGGWSISYGEGEHACSLSSINVFNSYKRRAL